MKKQKKIGAYELTIYLPKGEADGVIYIPSHGNSEEIAALLPEFPAALVFIGGFDWNRDLSPWPAKAVFGDEDFGGQADAFLKALTESLVPAAEQEMPAKPLWRGVAGYSLAGLFAVYAAYKSSLFTHVASVSGSMWFDGWMDYARNTPLAAQVTRAFFSVGAKEKKTRNLRMQPVEENTRAMRDLFEARGVQSVFVLNPGNHFVDAQKRLADALTCLME